MTSKSGSAFVRATGWFLAFSAGGLLLGLLYYPAVLPIVILTRGKLPTINELMRSAATLKLYLQEFALIGLVVCSLYGLVAWVIIFFSNKPEKWPTRLIVGYVIYYLLIIYLVAGAISSI